MLDFEHNSKWRTVAEPSKPVQPGCTSKCYSKMPLRLYLFLFLFFNNSAHKTRASGTSVSGLLAKKGLVKVNGLQTKGI